MKTHTQKPQDMTRSEWRSFITKKAVRYAESKDYLSLKNILSEDFGQYDWIDIESFDMISTVPGFSYITDHTTLTLPDGSHLRFATRSKSIDITRVWVQPHNHRKGAGTQLMNMFLCSLIKNCRVNENCPKIILECTGGVGLGENRQDTPIDAQIKFFNKFGFEFDREDKHGTVHMVLNYHKLLVYVSSLAGEDVDNSLATV